ncbi:hypothetical protein E2C01_006797 [Portunus trituberculatus]|uniref:Uncharacterized protein n=1 Tax=Portunus trituberculatus TaxID=210409 RepID=A0A5B7D2S8_PORTR|nr:hypothetical protein [Portunus trituberculatus]
MINYNQFQPATPQHSHLGVCAAMHQQLPGRVEEKDTEGTVERRGAAMHQDARLLKKGQLLRIKVLLQALLPLVAAAAAAVTALRLKVQGEGGRPARCTTTPTPTPTKTEADGVTLVSSPKAHCTALPILLPRASMVLCRAVTIASRIKPCCTLMP